MSFMLKNSNFSLMSGYFFCEEINIDTLDKLWKDDNSLQDLKSNLNCQNIFERSLILPRDGLQRNT